MKQLLILSGKGGTGKTTVASAFVKLSQTQAFADCDVDAPNLHLVTQCTTAPQTDAYFGLPKAYIDPSNCISCGRCAYHCQFKAIEKIDGARRVNQFACEGCGVCAYVCPRGAIEMQDVQAGEMQLFINPDNVFSTAQLKMGSGNSGMLVTQVKKRMRFGAKDAGLNPEVAIIDGSPGIGCPVIASLSGVQLALIVAEPSVSGISDLERIIHTAEIFHVIPAVCVNKYDTNIENTDKIEDFCYRRD
ncbi:MAG: 4Fe-4S binding protein, partial [Peptococcaceae bacterium]|nr:4Fe-4S binding protein [Peptococcaceae bacterium]